MTPSRRETLGLLAALALPGCAAELDRAGDRLIALDKRTARSLAALEARAGGRLGVYFIDTRAGASVGHREDERFGMCSTFKLPLAAIVLAEIDAGRMNGNEIIRWTEADMVSHHPVTGKHRTTGLSILALAEAAQKTSDNVAANLLLRRLGGPSGFTAKFDELGVGSSRITRLDRYETAMNLVMPGEVHDTTTPAAMANFMEQIFANTKLMPASLARLTDWTVATQTGLKRIRAGLPADWRAGDKTGTAIDDRPEGMVNKLNDIAIIFPTGQAPLIVTAYFDAPGKFNSIRPVDEAVLAEVGRIAAAWSMQNP